MQPLTHDRCSSRPAGAAEIQGATRGGWSQPESVGGRAFPLAVGFGGGSVSHRKRPQSVAWMILVVTLVPPQANGTVFLHAEQWVTLIPIIRISDEWGELGDSFPGQFVYPLTLFLEKWKCIRCGILCNCPCIYVTLEVSKTSNFMKKAISTECLRFCVQLKNCYVL